MKAAVIDNFNIIEIRDISKPEVTSNSVLLRVKSCGVCASDLRILMYGNNRVKFPAVIGHEISGEIVEKGDDVEKFDIGDRVSVGADVPCGKCDWCNKGMPNCCETNLAMGYQFQGGFAEYCLIDNLILNSGPIEKIPEHVEYDKAAIAEPLACCINGFEMVNMSPEKSILIIGGGPVGCMMTSLARNIGSKKIILAESSKERMELAKKFDADHLILNSEEDLVSKTKDLTNGKGVDVIIIACASPDAQEQALEVVAKRGHVNFFGGLPAQSRKINISSNTIHYNECFVCGSHGSTPAQYKKAVNLITSGSIDIDKVITHKFMLDDIKNAFEMMKSPKSLKIVVNP